MVDRIHYRSQLAATSLLSLLRSQTVTSIRPSPITSTSYGTLPTDSLPFTNRTFQPSHNRTFTSTLQPNVSAHRKQAGREKARLRSMRQGEKVLRRREKEGYSTPSRSPSSPRRPPRDPVEEDVESNIREYMARTGPRGERLTLAQQERLLKQELKGLGHQLEKLEKKAKADEATQDLPELDDHTLEELYQALMLPPPPTKEEARLARLEDARRQKSLESGSGRGRSGLERLGGVAGVLPMSVVEERKERTTRDLKQRLLDAREKGRVLLPPSASAARREVEAAVEEDLEVEEGEELDMAALPYAERQEIRLQQLFARLALVHSGPDPKTSTNAESLSEIKSSLATRIAKILQEHEYELPSSMQRLRQDDAPEAGDAAEAELPPFKDVRLDGKASSLPPDSKVRESEVEAGIDPGEVVSAPHRSKNEIDLVEKAESMINDLTSQESRTFMLDGIERLVRSATSSSSSSASTSGTDAQPVRLPLGVASIDEWTALCVSSARASDTATLNRTLSLMQLSGYHPPPLSLYNAILDSFATQGDVASCQHYLTLLTSQGLVPNDHTHHTLVKAYITSSQFLPAIQLLNSLEGSGAPASMATYTLVTSRLLSPGRGGEEKPELQALAWNLFYHMRLHAHPIPDAPLYALMIRACARGVPQPTEIDDPTHNREQGGAGVRISDAERALDLFREMTTRYNVRPNAEVYNSLILACARRKDFYLEAFRLLREMVELELSNPPPGPSEGEKGRNVGSGAGKMMRFAPDRYTFNALLQGCARNRDLARARWVLAEMIRTTLPLFDAEVRSGLGRGEVVELVAKRPGEESMCHVMHCYAAYIPLVKREKMQVSATAPPASTQASATQDQVPSLQEAEAGANQSASTDLATQAKTEMDRMEILEEQTTTPEEAAQIFSALVPQTSSDLVSEARSLFARILADQPHPSSNSNTSTVIEGPLGGVTPSTQLINSYLTVLAAHLAPAHRVRVLHSTLATTSDAGEEGLEHGLFARLGCGANEHTFRILLQAMCDASEAEVGLVQDVWVKFQSCLALKHTSAVTKELTRSEGGESEEKVDAVQVKKCWSAYIHFWAKNISLPHPDPKQMDDDGLGYAVDLLRRFYSLYPPQLGKVGGKKSKKATKRAREALSAQLRPHSGQLGDLDLSPLPLPLKSLEALQNLSTGAEAEKKGAISENTTLDKAGQEWIAGGIPSLTFLDVQLLHHRLVRYGRTKDLAFVSWVLHRYNAATRTRRG